MVSCFSGWHICLKNMYQKAVFIHVQLATKHTVDRPSAPAAHETNMYKRTTNQTCISDTMQGVHPLPFLTQKYGYLNNFSLQL